MFLRHVVRPFPTLLLLLVLVGGCKKNETSTAATQAQIEAQKKTDENLIKAYVAANNLTATRTSSGLYYILETPGPAGTPLVSSGKLVTMNYLGYLLNGTTDGSLFDSSYRNGSPLKFRANEGQVIAGWDEAVLLMRKGDRARLLIPSHLAYGPRPNGTIPANSVLIFYVVLENFTD
jgi:FKBP-type peptidyl-prolyl cis-trans isomerase FkpA